MPLVEQSLSAGEPWYASGTFWAIAAVVVGVVAIVVGAWAAFRSARPRRVLYVTVDSEVSLLRAAPGLQGSGLEVSHMRQPLSRPYVVTVDVVSRSVLDIAAAAFGETPLELEFGVPVVALLDQQSHPGRAAVRVPAVKVTRTALHVGPALLTRQHRLRYTVLLDGRPRFRPRADLADVIVHDRLPSSRRSWINHPASWTLFAFGAGCAAVIVTWLGGNSTVAGGFLMLFCIMAGAAVGVVIAADGPDRSPPPAANPKLKNFDI